MLLLRPASWLALLSRTFTFELALAGSPRASVEYDYVGKQSIPTTGLSPASPTALWAAPDVRTLEVSTATQPSRNFWVSKPGRLPVPSTERRQETACSSKPLRGSMNRAVDRRLRRRRSLRRDCSDGSTHLTPNFGGSRVLSGRLFVTLFREWSLMATLLRQRMHEDLQLVGLAEGTQTTVRHEGVKGRLQEWSWNAMLRER